MKMFITDCTVTYTDKKQEKKRHKLTECDFGVINEIIDLR